MENDMFQMMVTFERLYTTLTEEQSRRAKIRSITDLIIGLLQHRYLTIDNAISVAIETYNKIESEVSHG